jgi:hypothetical protein
MPVDEIKPRYEFRVWADMLAYVRPTLEQRARPKMPDRQEMYLMQLIPRSDYAKRNSNFTKCRTSP